MIDYSVLIPFYNTDPKHFREALTSILYQSRADYKEVVIVDDGSTDKDSLAVLREVLMWERRIRVERLDQNGGTSVALNRGHKVIESEYIAIMSSNDISLPDRFKKQIAFLERYPATDVLGTQLTGFWDDDPRKKVIVKTRHPSIPKGKGWLTNHGTVIYRNSAVKEVGGYDPEYRRGQDIYLWNKLHAAGKVFRNLDETLYQWRRFRK